jgi:hypothetical protein
MHKNDSTIVIGSFARNLDDSTDLYCYDYISVESSMLS